VTKRVPRYGPVLGSIVLAVLLVLASIAATSAVLRTDSESSQQFRSISGGDPLRVAVIGDSLSAGVNNTIVWTDVMADDPALSVSNVARVGSGYVGGVGTSGTFAQQVKLALASKPKVIVVFGGIYDLGKSFDLIAQSATDLLNDLHSKAPNARIVTVGPISAQQPPAIAVADVNRAIALAAESTHTEYINVVDATWMANRALLQADGNPNDAGQKVLAAQLGKLLHSRLTEGGQE
jgi:lysophospholipase L1-like esterase